MIRSGKKATFFLITAATLITVGSSPAYQQEPPATLATVGQIAISVDEFRSRYTDYLLRSGQHDDLKLRELLLNQLVAEKLILQDARDHGIEQDRNYLHQKESLLRKLLIDSFIKRFVYDSVRVSEADLSDMFVRINTRLKARHLYARTPEQANRLYERLRAGETFESLAREVFADTALANSGGSVGYFTFDEMDPVFEDAAFSLKVGEVSRPVRTSTGYSIIQLEDRFTHPLLTETEFAKKKDKLERFVRARKQMEARSAYIHELESDLDISIEADVFDRLAGYINGTVPLKAEEEEQWSKENLVLFRLRDVERVWTIANFREHARYTSDKQRSRVTNREDLADFIRGLVVRSIILDDARRRHLDTAPEFGMALAQGLDEWTVTYSRKKLEKDATVPEDSLRAYYELERSALTAPERVRVWEIMSETKETADQMLERARQSSFETVAREHSIRPGADGNGGDLGFITREQLGSLADPVFAAKEGDLIGPLEVAGRYVVFKRGPTESVRPLTFEEARSMIYDRLHRESVEKRFKTFARDLKSRYEVKIDRDRLTALSLSEKAQ